MRVWLAQDPRTGRVMMQVRPFRDGDFPPGDEFRGAIWPIREGEIDGVDWGRLMAGKMPPDEQDRLHREAWAAGTDGSAPGPPRSP